MLVGWGRGVVHLLLLDLVPKGSVLEGGLEHFPLKAVGAGDEGVRGASQPFGANLTKVVGSNQGKAGQTLTVVQPALPNGLQAW